MPDRWAEAEKSLPEGDSGSVKRLSVRFFPFRGVTPPRPVASGRTTACGRSSGAPPDRERPIKPTPPPSLPHQPRAAIARRNLTAYAVGAMSGVPVSVVARFLSRERGLTLASADRIAAALDL